VESLAVNNVNTFNYVVPDTFNSGQSDAQNANGQSNYVNLFNSSSSRGLIRRAGDSA
jgi:hypothetical protein